MGYAEELEKYERDKAMLIAQNNERSPETSLAIQRGEGFTPEMLKKAISEIDDSKSFMAWKISALKDSNLHIFARLVLIPLRPAIKKVIAYEQLLKRAATQEKTGKVEGAVVNSMVALQADAQGLLNEQIKRTESDLATIEEKYAEYLSKS